MKKFLRISWDIESAPGHLMVSLLMAFGVMMLINTLIGSMGGIPAFLAYVAVYYMLRGFVLSGNRISHQLGISSRRETGYLLRSYLLGYFLIWAAMKLLLLFSNFKGWGNIDGLSVGEYWERLYGSTMLEGWQYLFALLLMAAFVVSLFPLIVIRKRKAWLLYLAAVVALFLVVCLAVIFICQPFINSNLKGRAACVLDELLLCRQVAAWQAFVFVAAAALLAAAAGYGAFAYAAGCYAPKPGTIRTDESFLSDRAAEKNKRHLIAAGAGVAVAAGIGAAVYVFFGSADAQPNYYQVAECLTEDQGLGPMVYGGNVYLPVEEELDYYETGEAVGYLGSKGEDCSTRFYELTVGNVLYKNSLWEDEYLQVYGADVCAYRRITEIEQENAWQRDNVFLLWDEEWESEQFYSKEPTGYSVCERELIEGLEERFGVVNYRPSDFESYDAYFSIRGYASLKEAFAEETPYGDWVGCILVKDDKFYYGNYNNRITGASLEALMEVLGGY